MVRARWLAVVVVLLIAALAVSYQLLYEPQARALEEALTLAREQTLRAERAEEASRICAQDASTLNSRVAELEGQLDELRGD